jgi:hypothetical protein
VTQLRAKMLEELQRRNYSHRTARAYIRVVRYFAEHFHLIKSAIRCRHRFQTFSESGEAARVLCRIHLLNNGERRSIANPRAI